ncbi:unnamed protein product, partial [Brassica rapa]
SYTDSLRTNNREMDEINSKVDWDVSYRRRSTVRWTTHLSRQHQLWYVTVAGGTTEAVYQTKCGDQRAKHLAENELTMFVDVCGEEYSSRQLQSNNVYPN